MSENIYQSKKEKADRILNIILNAVFIGIFALSLLLVWGSSVRETLIDAYSDTLTFTDLDTIYLFKTGWENIKENVDTIETAKLTVALISFIITVAGVYFFSINGLINVIKSLIKKDNFNAHKDFIFGALIYLTYYAITGFLFSEHLNETYSYLSYSAGWGATGMGSLLNIGMLLIGGYYCFSKFDKNNVKGFVGSIFLCLTIGSMISLIQSASYNTFAIISISGEFDYLNELGFMNSLSFINTYFSRIKGEFYPLVFVTFMLLFLLIAYVLTNVILFALKIAKKENVNRTYLLISSIITITTFLIILILSMTTSGLIASKLMELYDNMLIGISGTGVIAGFVLSIFILGFSITAMILTKNNNANEDNIIDTQIDNN